MFKIIIASILLVFLTGCADKVVQEHYTNRDVITHPAWPKPIQERSVKTRVLVVNDQVFVARTYEDDLTFQQYQEDIFRWAEDMKSTLCFYRKALNEPQCETSTPVKEKKAP